MTIEEQIKAAEDEIQKTPYNKATQHHIGRLKAKLARLKDEQETRRLKGGGGGPSYAVKKSGNATAGLVGFPSVGKSTLLNQITDADSAVAAYDFTTLDVIPGLLAHRGAKIQILDMPGLIRGASKGRGRGKEVLSVARGCDLILLMIDVFETHVDVLADELHLAGIRLNERPADVTLTKANRGGLTVNPTVKLEARRGDGRGHLPGVGLPERHGRREAGHHGGPADRRPRGEPRLPAGVRRREQDRPRLLGLREAAPGEAAGMEARPDLRGEGRRSHAPEGRDLLDPPVHARLPEASRKGSGHDGSDDREAGFRRRHESEGR